MSKIEFVMKLPTNPEKLYELATDFENHKNLFPSQLKSIKIIKKSGTEIITEEVLVINTYFKNTEIHQTTKHGKKFPKIRSEIIEGPFKGSIIQIISHGLISAALFLCVGVVYDRVHSRLISS